MIRAFFCFVWSVVFFLVASVGTSLAAANGAGTDPAKQQQAAQKAGRELGPPILLGSIGFGVLGGVAGVLPGTGRRKRARMEEGSTDLPLLSPSYDPATAPLVRPVGASEHTFTFWGFLDRWARIFGGVPFFGIFGLFVLGSVKDPTALAVGIGLLGIALTILLFVAGRFLLVRRVRVDCEGVSWDGVLGSSFRAWDQIKTVWREESILNRRYRTRRITLKFTSGGSVSFDQALTDFSTLAETIQEATGRLLAPLSRHRLKQDGEVRFGAVTVHPDGLTMRGKFFPWNGISRFDIGNGHLVLYKSPRPKSGGDRGIALREVPNYHVLLELLGDTGVPWTSQW